MTIAVSASATAPITRRINWTRVLGLIVGPPLLWVGVAVVVIAILKVAQ